MGTRAATITLLTLALLAATSTATPAHAQLEGDPNCLEADPLPPIERPANDLRFGITPLLAGSAGTTQLEPVAEDPERAVAAVEQLRPGRKQLVMRLNRMFMADGVEGIRRYAAIVDRYAEAGIDSELQVRYHPTDEQEGDMAAWAEYVRDAARILGKRPSVTALSITNEANFSVSPNTSDGSYEGVREAILVGMIAADRELRRIGREDVELGFSFAWRWIPSSDRSFWEEIGERSTPAFRRALDYVGLQVYPHLVWPPVPRPDRTAGEEVVEALTLLRHCFMPKAGLGEEVDLWVTENGYASNLGRSEGSQVAGLKDTLANVHDYTGTLGVTDYRWFNLRDNRSNGPDLFDAVGVLRDDYSPKPAFGALRRWIRRAGTLRPRPRRCGGELVTIAGTPGRDRLVGTRGPDVFDARGGADRIRGRGGRDIACGGPGRDRIRGGRGSDLLRGGRGPDRLRGGPGRRDECHGGPGRDRRRGCERGS